MLDGSQDSQIVCFKPGKSCKADTAVLAAKNADLQQNRGIDIIELEEDLAENASHDAVEENGFEDGEVEVQMRLIESAYC